MGQTECRVVVEGDTVAEILDFDYSDDVMAIAEDAHFTVDNTGRKYRDKLRLGQRVEFILINKDVNGGAPTVKHRGRITRRAPKYNSTDGNVLAITSSDLGWHLTNSDAPLWLRLTNKTYADLVDPKVSKFFDPSWGFQGVRFDGDIRRKLKQGVAAVAMAAQQPVGILNVIQVEPGEKAADKFLEYCRRLNLLVNVSPDGYLCCYRPNDRQDPLFALRNVTGDSANNVLGAELIEDARTIYTDTVCVGEQIGEEVAVTTLQNTRPNARKKRGRVDHVGALPFTNRKTFVDGEMFENGLAQRSAEWTYKRGMFDAWYVVYDVAEHHQGGKWWVADSVVHIEDEDLGLSGNHYIQAVRCRGSKSDADVAQIVVRKPGLLSAAFGEIPNPPIYRASGVEGQPKAAQ